MPRRIEIPFIGPTAKDRSMLVSNQETLNFISAVKGFGSKAPIVLETAPGLVELGDAGDGPVRTSKMLPWKGALYAVFGTKLVKIETSGATEIGTLATSSAYCRMARGRNYLCIVDGTTGYTYDGTTFATITDLDFPSAPSHVVYKDGFFIVNDVGTDNFYISAIEDPTDWNALDFEAASVQPDNIKGHAATASILYIMGEVTTQLYYNTGNADFPYELMLNATHEVGLAAPDTLAESDDGVFMLATTPEGGLFVYRFQGQTGAVISGDEQEHELSLLSHRNAASAYIYKQAGKSFYVLNLDPGTPSLVFNIRANMWESRALGDGTAYRAGGAGPLDAVNVVGSRLEGKYYRLDLTHFTDAGEPLIRRRVTQIHHANNHLLDWHEVVVDIAGGSTTDPTADPQIRLRHSNDHGVWSSQLFAPLGKVGQTDRRAVFRNLGIARNKQFEVEVSDPCAVTIKAAYAAVTVLDD